MALNSATLQATLMLAIRKSPLRQAGEQHQGKPRSRIFLSTNQTPMWSKRVRKRRGVITSQISWRCLANSIATLKGQMKKRKRTIVWSWQTHLRKTRRSSLIRQLVWKQKIRLRVSLAIDGDTMARIEDYKKYSKKLKQIEKLEAMDRELNEDEKAKVSQKDDILKKMAELSIWLWTQKVRWWVYV